MKKSKNNWRFYKNVFLAIVVGLGLYFLFKLTNVSIESWFGAIFIFLMLILFELMDKK